MNLHHSVDILISTFYEEAPGESRFDWLGADAWLARQYLFAGMN